jgi:hypothetical protein
MLWMRLSLDWRTTMLIKFMEGCMEVAFNPATVKMIKEFEATETRVYLIGEEINGHIVLGSFNEVVAKLSPKPHIGIETVL